MADENDENSGRDDGSTGTHASTDESGRRRGVCLYSITN